MLHVVNDFRRPLFDQDEVREYAKWLGMELEHDRDLFWIAKEGLKAPLPENWKPCKTVDTDEIYYFNFATGEPLQKTLRNWWRSLSHLIFLS